MTDTPTSATGTRRGRIKLSRISATSQAARWLRDFDHSGTNPVFINVSMSVAAVGEGENDG